MALAVAAAGDEPVEAWIARAIRAYKPDTTAAERQRRRRELARKAQAGGDKA